jgi:hypothetical protein
MRLTGEMLILYCFCAVTACAAGKLLGHAGRIRILQARTLESFALAAWLGTGLLFSVFGWSSYLGLPGRWALLVVGLVVLALLGIALLRRGLRSLLGDLAFLHPSSCILYPSRVALLLAVLLSAVLTLLPIPVGQCYDLTNDAAIYIAVSEWLQDNAFGRTAVGDPSRPLSGSALHFQEVGHRIGATFYHAFVTACVPRRSSFDTYLPVTAWGVSLNVLGIFLLARWAFGVPRLIASLGACLVALLFNPLATSASYGFMHQLYGTAGLVFTLALAARATAPRGPWSVMLLVSFSASCWLTTYNEMVPLVGLVLLGWGLVVLARAVRSRSWASLGGWVIAGILLALLTTHELVRLTDRITVLGLVTGSPRPYSLLQFWAFAMGGGMVQFYLPLEVSWPITVLASIALALAFLRLFRLRSAVVFLLFVACLGLACYFRLAVDDPWSHERGHTWNLFKACKWAYPLAAVLQIAGLRELLLRASRPGWILAALCLATATWALPQYHRSAQQSSAGLRHLARSETPLAEGRALLHALRGQGGARPPCWIYLINDHPGGWSWNRGLIGLWLTQNHHESWYRFANDWRHSLGLHHGSCGKFELDRPLPDDPADLLVLATTAYARAQDAYVHLPWELTVLPSDRPVVFDVQNPQGLERRPDGVWFVWVGPDAVRLRVWSPRAARVSLCCDLAPGPGLPMDQPRTLEWLLPGSGKELVTLSAPGSFQVPVQMAPGVNDILVRSVTSGERTLPANGDTRRLHVCVSGWQLQSAPSAPSGVLSSARAGNPSSP